MAAGRYEGLSRADRLGCGVAGLVGIPILFLLFGLAALGDCASDCNWGKDPVLNVLLPFVAITAAVFFAVRWLVRRSN